MRIVERGPHLDNVTRERACTRTLEIPRVRACVYVWAGRVGWDRQEGPSRRRACELECV